MENSFSNEYKEIYSKVKECVILLENGTRKVFSNDGRRGEMIVNVLFHDSDESQFAHDVLHNYKDAKNLTELSAICGFNSVKTFTRHFRKNFKTTPKQWLLEIKKEEMIDKLLNTNMPVKQIASELGFTTPSHFCDFCRKKTGKRPEEIRKGKLFRPKFSQKEQ